MTRIIIWVWLALALALPAAPAAAVEPDEILKNPVLEARAREISRELRCLVCQNQSIDDSNAPLAKDLRLLVRERLSKGDTNAEAVDFIVARYGEFVLLRPPFAVHTLILWLAVPLLFLLGVAMIYRAYMRRLGEASPHVTKRLTAKEKRELEKLLKET